jgi:hypothetical protein
VGAATLGGAAAAAAYPISIAIGVPGYYAPGPVYGYPPPYYYYRQPAWGYYGYGYPYYHRGVRYYYGHHRHGRR